MSTSPHGNHGSVSNLMSTSPYGNYGSASNLMSTDPRACHTVSGTDFALFQPCTLRAHPKSSQWPMSCTMVPLLYILDSLLQQGLCSATPSIR